jgi:hypothetical protein
MKRTLVLLLLLALVIPPALAEAQDGRIRIFVSDDSSENDILGKNLIYKFKRGLRRSKTFALVESKDQACFYVSIQTTSYDEENNATIYDIIWLLIDNEIQIRPFFLDGSLGISGYSKLDSSARGILETTEKVVQENRNLIVTCQHELSNRY